MTKKIPLRYTTLLTLAFILSALIVGIWVPMSFVFWPTDFDYDKPLEVSLLVLTVATVIYQLTLESANLQSLFTFSYLIELTACLPLVGISYLCFGVATKALLLLKLLIIPRVMEIRRIIESMDSLHPVVSRLLPIFLMMPIVIHILSCGWLWLGAGTAGVTGDHAYDYAKAVYWAVTTLSTVGYGDITAKTVPQMLFSGITMILGVAFFGYVLSNVASILARMNAAREDHLSKVDRVESFMRSHKIPTPIRLKVRAYYRYLWEKHQGYDDDEILHTLPTQLRSEVSLFLNRKIISKVPLFKEANPDLIHDIVLALKPKIAVPQEKIFHFGEVGDAMYFLQKGNVKILGPEGQLFATLQPGSFFGETALLTSNPRSATAQADEYTDLCVLSREDFERVISRYPQFRDYVHEISAKRVEIKKPAA